MYRWKWPSQARPSLSLKLQATGIWSTTGLGLHRNSDITFGGQGPESPNLKLKIWHLGRNLMPAKFSNYMVQSWQLGIAIAKATFVSLLHSQFWFLLCPSKILLLTPCNEFSLYNHLLQVTGMHSKVQAANWCMTLSQTLFHQCWMGSGHVRLSLQVGDLFTTFQ